MRLKDEDRLAERDLIADLIADYLLQIVRTYIADFLQVICRLFAGNWLLSGHGTVSNPYLGFFSRFPHQ